MSNKETIAYLAGIIDGEGTIRIKKDLSGVRSGKQKSPTYHEMVSAKMCTPKPLEMMKKIFGGSLYQEKRVYQSVSGFKTNKVMWDYQCSDLQAANCCKILLPYLKVKNVQAHICLKLRRSKQSKLAHRRGNLGGRRKGKGRSMSKKVLQFRDDLWNQIKIIHRGASK